MEIFSYLLTQPLFLFLLICCLIFSVVDAFKLFKKERFSIKEEIGILAKPLVVASFALVLYNTFSLLAAISEESGYMDIPFAMGVVSWIIIYSLAGLFISSGLVFLIFSIFNREKFLKTAIAFIFVIPAIAVFFFEAINHYTNKNDKDRKWYYKIGKDVFIIFIIIFSMMVISGESNKTKNLGDPDSTIISAMSQIRPVSEIIYSNYDNGYKDVCGPGNIIGSVETLEYIREEIENSIVNKSVSQHSFAGTYTPYCISDQDNYCVSVLLSDAEYYYCANSSGVMGRSYNKCGLDRNGAMIPENNGGIYGCDSIIQDDLIKEEYGTEEKTIKDSQVKSSMDQIRPVTAIVYLSNNSYENVCESGNVLGSTSGLETIKQSIEANIINTSTSQHSLAGTYTPYCVAEKNNYCISVMLSSGKHYCVTSFGGVGVSYNRCGLDKDGRALPESEKGPYGCDFVAN